MGSATAWQLALRGRDVHLFERFEPGHTHGASHGRSRNFNLAYSAEPYVSMLVEASRLWRELEEQSGAALLETVGLVNHGAPQQYGAVADALAAAGFDAEFVEARDAAARWPGIRFTTTALFSPQSGRLDADASVAALQSVAAAHGATVHHGARVLRLDVAGDDRVVLEVERAGVVETVVARRVVVTVGGWTEKLLGGVLRHPRLVVTQEQPAHFAALDDSIAWPGFNHGRGPDDDYWYSSVYGMFTPGLGVKAGWHGVGPVVDPDRRDYSAEPVQFAALQRYVRDWLPGADADRFETISCTYTTTPDSDFVLDRVGPVVVGAGFSGHGFKFTPSVGRILADLVDGSSAAPDVFALR